MKLWFEGRNVNAHDASTLRRALAGGFRDAGCAINGLAVNPWRGDSAANNFLQ
jgi:hypothetical protein